MISVLKMHSFLGPRSREEILGFLVSNGNGLVFEIPICLLSQERQQNRY